VPKLDIDIRGAVGRLFVGEGQGEIVISGPAGTGKTRGILDWIHMRLSTETLRFLMLRKTLESLKTSALVTYQEQVLYGFNGRESVADGVVYFGGNAIRPASFTYAATGSQLIIGGLDNPSRVLSTEYDGIYVNEATEVSLTEWETLGGRVDRPTMRTDKPASILLGDCNPGPPKHWIKQREAAGILKLWPTTHKDNPAMWDNETHDWTESGIRYLMRLQNYTGVRRERFLFGRWAAAEGQVYEAFDETVHIIDRRVISHRLKSMRFFGTVDWGWTAPGVIQIWAVDADKRLYLVAEYYATRKSVTDWWIPRAKELAAEFGVYDWFCDPSEPAYIEEFNKAGLMAWKAHNAIMPGVTAVEERLRVQGDGRARIYFLSDASRYLDPYLLDDKLPVSTLYEFPEYVWPKNPAGMITKDKPVDENNHGLDCVRYAVAQIDLATMVDAGPVSAIDGGTVFVMTAPDQGFTTDGEWGRDPWEQ
jgi:phage terminase large subunit